MTFTLLQINSISNRCCSLELSIQQRIDKTELKMKLFNILYRTFVSFPDEFQMSYQLYTVAIIIQKYFTAECHD